MQGNTAGLTNPASAIIDRILYTPYGSIRYRKAAHDTPFLFGGFFGIATDSNGLVHMRARYYNPLTMRFLNSDPAQDGWNWYAYANGNLTTPEAEMRFSRSAMFTNPLRNETIPEIPYAHPHFPASVPGGLHRRRAA